MYVLNRSWVVLVFIYAPIGMDKITKYQIIVFSYVYFSATFSSLP